jgi:hypothetical protein
MTVCAAVHSLTIIQRRSDLTRNRGTNHAGTPARGDPAGGANSNAEQEGAMSGFWSKSRFKFGNQRGFNAGRAHDRRGHHRHPRAIAIPLYNNVQARARIAKAQADIRSMASAVTVYAAHVGSNPTALALLTATAANGLGQTAGPFMAAIPSPPTGWQTPYDFATAAGGFFTISATGDGVTASAPSPRDEF